MTPCRCGKHGLWLPVVTVRGACGCSLAIRLDDIPVCDTHRGLPASGLVDAETWLLIQGHARGRSVAMPLDRASLRVARHVPILDLMDAE